ncbi:hypothetical protein [Streptomyces sp. NPDC056244]|uniref:hypothetical protein n=1 Tax=Streptomyces sp. NPDC056244 TaxID=3345762 RepID=UPI0035E0506B
MNPPSGTAPQPDNTPRRVPHLGYDDVLRAALADTANAVTPSPVPLAAIERSGRARRRRGNAALVAAGCGLLLGPLAVVLVRSAPPPDPVPPPVPVLTAPPTPSPAPAPARVVRPGERVKAAPGVEVWLTGEGKHWSTPDGEQFRSVIDGNLNLSTPDVSRQSEPAGDSYFHSGLYYGTRDAVRVEITTATGRVMRAELLELAGRPGWGVWYATTEPPPDTADLGAEGMGAGAGTGGNADAPADFIRRVTLYDATGEVLAALR